MANLTETKMFQVLETEMLKMLARGLDWSPSPEDLPAKIVVMCEDLFRHGFRDHDAPRIATAFQFLGPRIQRWPTSKQIIDVVQRPNQQPRLEHQRDWDRLQKGWHKLADLCRQQLHARK